MNAIMNIAGWVIIVVGGLILAVEAVLFTRRRTERKP